jgi:hypothetical protein
MSSDQRERAIRRVSVVSTMRRADQELSNLPESPALWNEVLFHATTKVSVDLRPF